MKRLFEKTATALFALAFLFAAAPVEEEAFAQSNSDQSVTIRVEAIDSFGAPGGTAGSDLKPVTLVISEADRPGEHPTPATDASTGYALTTNGSSRRITASLGSAYSEELTLEANLTAPGDGSSRGYVELTESDQVVVEGISTVAASTMEIKYRASATVQAGIVDGETQTVTYTMTTN